MIARNAWSVVALLLGAASVRAQPVTSRIPIRPLGPITAVSRDTLGERIVVRALPDGSVLVGEYGPAVGNGSKRRIRLFDPSLQQATLVRDSTHVPQLIPYTADSTILLDQPSRSMVIIDGRGRDARTMAVPKVADLGQLGTYLRAPRFDRRGGLVYQGLTPPLEEPTIDRLQQPWLPDSSPLVRGDFDTRRVDTLTRVRLAQPVKGTFTDRGQLITTEIVIDPTATADEWTMLPDGTIAIVRERDYHIDWIDPDGTRRSTPRMSYDWRPITDARKQFIRDSMQPTLDSLAKRRPPVMQQTPEGPRNLTWTHTVIANDKFPSYEPSIGPGSVRADLDGNVWIAPRTSAYAKGGGLLYDVVNRRGEITERVQFPPGVALVAFGDGGVVYLHRVQGRAGFLERARLR